jgi:hypothetical protein
LINQPARTHFVFPDLRTRGPWHDLFSASDV